MLAVLLAAALAPRLSAADAPTIRLEDRKYYYEDIYDPFFAPDPRDPSLLRSRRVGANPSSFPRVKAPDAFRVFLIGGSTMGGFFGEHDLQHALKKALPSRKVEVVNCGMSSYDTSRETLVEKEVLRYAPDLLVFISGHNDFFQPHPKPVARWILRAQNVLGRFAWYRAFHARVTKTRLIQEDMARQEPFERLLADFHDNVRKHVALAAARGVKVVNAKPPINYRVGPRGPLPLASPAFLKGWLESLRGDDAAALAVWGKPDVVESPETRAARLYYMARSARRLRRLDDYRRLRDESFAADVDGKAYNLCAVRCGEAGRAVAEETRTPWADLDAAFREAAWPDLPGPAMFLDSFHWSRRCHSPLTFALIGAMRRDPDLARLPWDDAALSLLRARWAREMKDDKHWPDDLSPRLQALSNLHAAVQGFATIAALDERALASMEALAEKYPDWFKSDAALRVRLDEAESIAREHLMKGLLYRTPPLQTSPDLFYWHLGELRLRAGKPREALEAFARVGPDEAGFNRIWLSRALAQGLSGDKAGARRSLERARVRGLGGEADAIASAMSL